MTDQYSLHRGDARTLKMPVLDETGAAVDLSGESAIVFAMARRIGAAPVVTKSLGAGITVAGDENNILLIALEAEDTANLAPGAWYIEVETRDGQDRPSTLALESNRIILLADLIRP